MDCDIRAIPLVLYGMFTAVLVSSIRLQRYEDFVSQNNASYDCHLSKLLNSDLKRLRKFTYASS